VSLASLAGERMFFEQDSSSGVSGDLESATAVASYMEGFWGMGTTVSSYSTARALEVGSPGGIRRGDDSEARVRQRLADRIEDNLTKLLDRTEELLRENRNEILALAHALEAHKTISGEDVEAIFEGRSGPLVDGTPYVDASFLAELGEYHVAALRAHREHGKVQVSLPVPQTAIPPWAAGVIVADDPPELPPGLNGHNHPDQA
jgi:cell division protease FtsH